eukprot:Gb_04445 [translate_table: standard]
MAFVLATVKLISPDRLNIHRRIHLLFTTSAAAAVRHQPTQLPTWKPKPNIVNMLAEEESGSILKHTIDSNSYGLILQACVDIKSLNQLHAHILLIGHTQNVFLGTKLVSMYALFGNIENARLVFDKMQQPNIFLWNEIIKGCTCNGFCEEALALYYQMQQAGIQPNNFTFPFVLKACASLTAVQHGKEIHDQIIRSRFESYVCVGNALVDMYAKCGNIDFARHLFDGMSKRDVVTWTAMIAGYVQNGQANEALKFFHQMQLAGVKPNRVTILSLLSACADLAALQQGKDIHDYVIKSNLESDVSVATALIAMYAKCSGIKIARQLFDKMSKRDMVSWSGMIAAYAQNGYANEALTLFDQMQAADVKPSSLTIVSVLQACAHLGALQQGSWIHDYIIRSGMKTNVFVETALIDMYAKCGCIGMARQLFDKMSKRNVVSWSAMIAGYGMHGNGEDALLLFNQMQEAGMKPNHITFICVLFACSHAGLVDKGWQYFCSMSRDYCITPRVEHYTCMVDLLGRAGCLDEAQDFIKKMPLKPDVGVWGALLGACRIHSNIELGEHVAERLFELEPDNAGYYVLLSNIYAEAGRWDEVEKVRTVMENTRLRKAPGCSLIEVNNRFHAFLVGDKSHPQSDEIYAVLETLTGQMKDAGYVPNTDFVLHEVEEETKELMPCSYGEKLAVAFGLISTSPGIPIQISKNLRAR